MILLIMSTGHILQTMVSCGRLVLLYCSQWYPVDNFYCYIAANGILWTTSTAILQPIVSHGRLLLVYDPTHDVHRSYIASNGIPWMTSTATLQPMVSRGRLLLLYSSQWYPVDNLYYYIAANGIPWPISTAI